MSKLRGVYGFFIFLWTFLMLTVIDARSEVTFLNVYTTDVTPSSFSIIWQASQSAVPGISIFSDAAGIDEITTAFEVVSLPLHSGNPGTADEYHAELDKDAIRNAVRALGLMKITVYGCAPETTYYFRVVAEAGGEIVSWPAGDPAEVITMRENAFVSDSKQLLINVRNNAGNLDATGFLVTAFALEARFPIAEFVGDGAYDNQAFLNLSQLFGADGFNWASSGIKEIEIKITGADTGPVNRLIRLDFSNDFAVSAVYPVDINVDQDGDNDGDGLPDEWEQQIIDADSEDSITTVFDVLPADDFDGDGLTNQEEYENESDPVAAPQPIPGDLNDDGTVTLGDAVIGVQMLAGLEPSSGIFKNADINGDSRIGLEEVICILQNVAGIRELPR